MSNSHDGQRPGPLPAAFRVPCPSCHGGVRSRARFGLRHERSGTGHIHEPCGDCAGLGWLPLGSGEWRRRSASGH